MKSNIFQQTICLLLVKVKITTTMSLNKNIHRILRCSYSQSALPVPVIKIPKYVKKHVEKVKTIQEKRQSNLRRKITYRGNTSISVISSTEGEYNHYLGQEYNNRYPLPLLSKYWLKEKSSGQKFTIHPHDSNPSLPILKEECLPDSMNFQCVNDFAELNLNPAICKSLREDFNFEAPTPIQTLVIPRILEQKNVLLAAETGCGKTIAYLAPLIQQVENFKKIIPRQKNTPLGLVIVPGRELAEQIAEVAYKLGSGLGVNTKVLLSDGTLKRHLRPTTGDIDILVSTVGSLVKLKKRVFKLSNLQNIILDEADTLTDDSFIEDLTHILKKLLINSEFEKFEGRTQGLQITFVSSIYPSNISELFSDMFSEKDLEKICSNYLHRVLPHVEQKFWRVQREGRAGELLQLVKSSYQKKEPTLVFCNKSPACDWMSLYLQNNGVLNGKLHGGVDSLERSKTFDAFQRGYFDILCCTDLVSRGLDTQRVRHVINFDFPNSSSDYILRCGRVGRVGSNHGRVTNLISAKSGVYTVQEIESGIRNAVRIPNVDSNIKRKINKLFFSH